MEHEAAFIKSFVLPEKQARWLELLPNAKRRHIFLHRLADDRDFNPKFRVDIIPSQQKPESVERILKQNGAPERCYVISESPDIDGKEMPLSEALEEVLGYGMGSLLSCIPGKLVYYEGEMLSDRYILKK
jgi:hypothetical protein